MSIRLEVQRAVWDALASAVSSSPGPSPQRILVAVSGGLDSMVLLSAAREVAASHGLALSAIHVNHHLRATAAADAAWVRHYCTVHDIPLRIAHVHLDEVPPVERRGPEADARRLRYQAVAEEARRIGAAAVLLAHHADDQVETVLLRLMRGTSVTGLHGMLPHTEHHGVVWLRPLLLFTKQQLAEYARQERIDYVEDDSNLDERYTRNYLRHRVVPLLRARQPRLAETVGQMCQILRDEDDYLEAAARRRRIASQSGWGTATALMCPRLRPCTVLYNGG
ncbi:hypothetical protein GCM10025857_18680 [Alicyclobacillus contaminans]|nr:hypothetical protein GCM10025857_18680 [Alicyclobacillus contaminans]